MSETPSGSAAFNLLWFFTEGSNADMMVRRALFTFYGIQIVTPIGTTGGSANCVYFDYSAAYAMPHVNGLIVSENDSLRLCLNEFSPTYEEFRQTKLVQQFGKAIYDPSQFDQKEGTIVLRSDISRKNQNEVLDELERKTGIRYTIIEMNRYTF